MVLIAGCLEHPPKAQICVPFLRISATAGIECDRMDLLASHVPGLRDLNTTLLDLHLPLRVDRHGIAASSDGYVRDP